MSQSSKAYSTVLQEDTFPTDEQAIILDAIDGITVTNYATEVGKVIGPTNVRYISRISHSRVCLYLSFKDLVDVINNKTIIVSNNTLIV